MRLRRRERACSMRNRARATIWAYAILGASAIHAQPASPSHCRPGAVARHSSRGLAYEVTGCGPALLLLHGFSADRRMWRDLVPTWRLHARVVLVDLKSHGASAMAASDEDPVDELLAVLRDEQLDTVAIVGHSAGAALAVELAARAPSRISALVLLSPSLNGFVTRTSLDLSAVAERVRAGDPPGAAEAWLASPVMRTNLTATRTVWLQSLIRANTRVWQRDAVRGPPPRTSVAERLDALRMPLFVGEGMLDVSGTSEVADAIARAHPDAVREQFRDGGHWFPVEQPEAVRERVLAFLVRAWSRRGRLASPPSP